MITLYNSLHRQKENFKPIKKNKVGLYTCGPTVYNYAHIGNLRTYIFEDTLKRVLGYNKYKVKHIMNITDVGHLTDDADEGEDKIEKGSKKEGLSAWEIAKKYEQAFKDDLKDLNIISPSKYTRATSYIKEQIKFIKKIEKNGFAYKTSDGLYFDTSKLKSYGKLANLENQKLEAGKRVALGEKKNPTDFALWKLSNPEQKRQMEWKSPWGTGFPGWHIECSAMSAKELGLPFDIHCGGIDHIPVHHTNEIAQCEASYNKKMANFWIHGEFLVINSGKMAKSEGNFITLQTLKDKNISPLSYRYFLLQTHYRKQLTFSWEALESAQIGLRHLYEEVHKLKKIKTKHSQEKIKREFLKKINDDLDIPGALAFVWTNIKENKISYKTLLGFDKVLGLNFKNHKPEKIKITDEIQNLLDSREKARKNKDWKESDRLRDEIQKSGFKVEDTSEGQKMI